MKPKGTVNMKRNLLFLIVISLLLTLCACSGETAPLSDISDYSAEASIPAASDTSDIDPADGFSVKESKYTYLDTGVVLLNVENKTQKNYNVTIHGTYLDEDGNAIKEETKTFEGFAAGWQNYFMFWPDIMFDKFTYTMEFQEFTGECVASKLKIQWNPGKTTEMLRSYTRAGDIPGRVPPMYTSLLYTNEGELPMRVYFHYIVFDSNDEIYFINNVNAELNESRGRNPCIAVYPPQIEEEIAIELACDDVEFPERLSVFNILIVLTGAEWDASWSA